jgi:cyclopropane fatty-acyl-phospholipid synthase-like methyltransferase
MAQDWRAYWSERSSAEHRDSSEEFFAKHAEEKLLHLAPGMRRGALLDVGCGAADLLVYYAPHYQRVIGVDFSPAMVSKARERIAGHAGARHAEVFEADDTTVWERASGQFDCITAGGVVQYWDPGQLDRFIARAVERLAAGGRIVLFEIIDPRLYPLHALGQFRLEPTRLPSLAVRAAGYAWSTVRRVLAGETALPLGHGYTPAKLQALAERHGLSLQLAWSMYYEYRYHAILRRVTKT